MVYLYSLIELICGKKIILIILITFTSCKNSNTKNKDHSESDKDIEYVDLIGDFKRKDFKY